jgi:hypothetical protein
MSEDTLKRNRRSTRLSISIPLVISGVDGSGNDFSEGVRTLVVNKHGAKIATLHHLPLGTEVLIENPALHVEAKAKVVWRDDKPSSDDLQCVALQLLEAQNIWGIAFPPDDWSTGTGEATLSASIDPLA